jgi:catechol 2,3-dioxygenase-like lactoylglutathione lyase family enzyme
VPPRVNGVLETGIYVEDIERSRAFYERIFGFDAIFVEERIVTLAVAPAQVLIIFRRGGTLEPVPVAGSFIPPHDGGGPQHFAFGIAARTGTPGRRISRPRALPSRARCGGRRAAPASISAIPTACWSSWRRRACGETGGHPLVSAGEKPMFHTRSAGLEPGAEEEAMTSPPTPVRHNAHRARSRARPRADRRQREAAGRRPRRRQERRLRRHGLHARSGRDARTPPTTWSASTASASMSTRRRCCSCSARRWITRRPSSGPASPSRTPNEVSSCGCGESVMLKPAEQATA